jgi:ubiquinone/menaquinone biosynthesis C-methylase UbiE
MRMSSNLFTGTASAYAEFRPPYPVELIDLLAGVAPGHDRLVDLGCGTGELARPLSRRFGEVLAVDPEPGMIAAGTQRAAADGIDNIGWLVAKAETAELGPPHSVDLLTIGSAFHWMDRPLVLQLARTVLRPAGVLAVVGGNSPWTGSQPWQQVIVEVLEQLLGPGRRAGDGVFRRPAEPHQVVLARHGFSDVEQRDFATPYEWTLDTILGYLGSTSFASRAVLGDRAEEFETILTARLLELNPAGVFTESLPFYALIGHPDGADG